MYKNKAIGYTEGMGTVNTALSLSWRSFDGSTRTIGELDHQHLCNIYYFMKYTSDVPYDAITINIINNELANRFGDVLLPYKPLKRFKLEMDLLSKKGYLQPNGDIIVNGDWIGKVEEN